MLYSEDVDDDIDRIITEQQASVSSVCFTDISLEGFENWVLQPEHDNFPYLIHNLIGTLKQRTDNLDIDLDELIDSSFGDLFDTLQQRLTDSFKTTIVYTTLFECIKISDEYDLLTHPQIQGDRDQYGIITQAIIFPEGVYKVLGRCNPSAGVILEMMQPLGLDTKLPKYLTIACICDGLGGFLCYFNALCKEALLVFHTKPDDPTLCWTMLFKTS